jgi:hypothetical protein
MVAEESGVANPQKVAKIDEKSEKRWVGNTAFANELPDSWVLLLSSVVIGVTN